MIFSVKIAMYFFSICLLSIVLLFFVTLGGIFSAYLYKKIGDDTAWNAGFNSLNPLNHIDYFVIIFFIITGWFIGMKKPTFLHNWKDGFKGFCQKLVFIFCPAMFHLFIASFLLFIGVYFFSYQFFLLACKTSLKANYFYISEVSKFLQIKGPKLIFSIFSLYGVILNLNLALLDFLFSILDYIIKKYFFDDMLNIKFVFLLYATVILLLYLFGNGIMYFFWNIIIIPLLLLF